MVPTSSGGAGCGSGPGSSPGIGIGIVSGLGWISIRGNENEPDPEPDPGDGPASGGGVWSTGSVCEIRARIGARVGGQWVLRYPRLIGNRVGQRHRDQSGIRQRHVDDGRIRRCRLRVARGRVEALLAARVREGRRAGSLGCGGCRGERQSGGGGGE
ncbi:hypothetical protein GS493_24825 [Rhodococcus hoagii]|nr:hypothetical protein [Prescottella equi]